MSRFFSFIACGIVFAAFFPSALTVETAATTPARNKEIVREFFEIAFNEHRPADAVQKDMGSYYIQHNPHAANGAEAFLGYFETFFKEHPRYRISIKRMIAEGDLVVVHLHAQTDEKDPGQAVVDILRIENGKIVEHWDVVQPVPGTSANENTMF